MSARRCLLAAGTLLMLLGSLAAPARVRADREACLTAHEQGQMMRLRGQYNVAREQFDTCKQASCPRLIQQDCAALLRDLDASRAQVVFAITDERGQPRADARVFVDGRPLSAAPGSSVPLDPGRYALRVEAPGQAPLARELTIAEGDKSPTVRVQLVPPGEPTDGAHTAAASAAHDEPALGGRAAHSAKSTGRLAVASYALGGAALAVLATGIAVGASGKREYERLERACDSAPCQRAQTEKGRRLYIGADVAFGLSAALAVTATSLFLVDRFRTPEDAAPARASVNVHVERAGATLAYRGVFW